MVKEVVVVDGMSCNHCENNIKQSLTAINGITDVQVSLSNKEVVVSFEETAVSLHQIKEAIDDLGFDVRS